MKKTLITAIVFLAITHALSAQCISGGSQSEMTANPEEKIDAIFNFDYEINSTIEYQRNGEVKRLALTYYVNTQDGSMFFPKGILTANDFEAQSEYFRFNGTVWLANRQMVNYMLDKKNNQLRAMTVNSNQSSSDVFINQHTAILSFFNDRNEPGVEQLIPEPMPASVDWGGITHGFAGYVYDHETKAKWTLYLDEQPAIAYKTSVPKVGFLVGILNFFNAEKCNALIVFSKVEQENGDYIQEELTYITPQEKSFNGTSYKPFGLLEGITGTQGNNVQNMKANMAAFQSRMIALGKEIEQLQKEKRDCRNTIKGDPSPCNDRYDPQIKKAKDESKKLQDELMKKMGAGDMIKN